MIDLPNIATEEDIQVLLNFLENNTFALCEAKGFEQHTLWLHHAKEAEEFRTTNSDQIDSANRFLYSLLQEFKENDDAGTQQSGSSSA